MSKIAERPVPDMLPTGRARGFFVAAMSLDGRQREVANGSFGAFQFEEPGFG